MYLVDSHCHLGDLDFGDMTQDFDEVLENAAKEGVTHMLCVNTDLPSFPAMYEKIKDLPNVWATVGTHPENLGAPWTEDLLKKFAAKPKVIAIGEIGLDYHYCMDVRDQQIDAFRRQIRVAKEVKKPIVIHAREAGDELFDVVESENAAEVGGIFHCYADTLERTKRALDLGFYVSVSGIVTFKKALNIKDLAKFIPLDRLLVETDSPYLAPVPFRGKPNQPAYVSYVAREIAAIRGISYEDVCSATSANFERLFGVSLADGSYTE